MFFRLNYIGTKLVMVATLNADICCIFGKKICSFAYTFVGDCGLLASIDSKYGIVIELSELLAG